MKTARPPPWTDPQATITSPLRRDDVIEEIMDGEAVLLDPRDGRVHRLNVTALMVWHGCDGRTSTRSIADRLVESFAVDAETALECVDQLIALFAQLRLFATSAPRN